MQYTDQFQAMGTTVDVILEASDAPLDAMLSIRLLFERQEAEFSRFRPSSLLTRLNDGEEVDDPTFAAACELALRAHAFTNGLFNPMILPALVDAGYDRNFPEVAGGRPRGREVPDPRDCLVVEGHRVRLRRGALDLGGIVKGWTVDLAIDLLRGRCEGALVNAGGDLRTMGTEDGGQGWWCEIDGPGGVAWQGYVDGALATSSSQRRRWITDSGGVAHHVIDPRSGLPAAGPLAQVTAWSVDTWQAECWAKAVLTGGPEVEQAANAAGVRTLSFAGDEVEPRGCHARSSALSSSTTSP